MRVRVIPCLFVLLLVVFLLPSITYADSSSDDEITTKPPTRQPTLTPTTTQPPTTLTPTTRTPTPTPTQTPTTPALATMPPTTIPPVIPTGTGTGGGVGTATGTGLNPTTPPPTMRPPPPPLPCDTRGMCAACTMDGQCSWCADTSTCVAQQTPTLCSARGWRTVPSTCAAPPFNPFLQQPQQQAQQAQAQAVELGTITATNMQVLSNNKLLQNIEPTLSFVYIQLDVLTPNAPPLMLRLLVQQANGMTKEILTSTPSLTGPSFVTIRPSSTNIACSANLIPGTGTCNFIIQVTPGPAVITNNAKARGFHTAAVGGVVDTPIDFKLSFTRGVMAPLNFQVKDMTTIVNDTAVFIGLEFPTTSLDVKITLIPDPANPNTDLDLFVAHMSSVNNPRFPDHQVGRGTNAQESLVINAANFVPGLYIVAVVPVQIDPMRKPFTLDLVKNFKQEFVIAVSTLAIIVASAVLASCIFIAIAVIAKRRRRAFLAAQAATAQAFVTPAPAGPVGLTPEELELIPIHSFEKNVEASSDDSLCSICLCDYEVGQPVRTLACLHHFHTSCVDPWLKDHRTCPNCRKDATEGLKVLSSSSKENDSDAPLSVVVDPNPAPPPAPLPSPRGLGVSVTHTGSGSASGSFPHVFDGDRAISPVDIEAHFPHYAATQSSGSSSSSHPSYPSYASYPSPSPRDSSLSARRLSQPRDPWQDMAPGMPQGQE